MRRHLVPLPALAVLALAVVTLAVFVPLAHAATTTATPATLPIGTAPSTEPATAPNPAATGTILMVKLPVGNVAAAEKFYGAVFGAKLTVTVSERAHRDLPPPAGPD